MYQDESEYNIELSRGLLTFEKQSFKEEGWDAEKLHKKIHNLLRKNQNTTSDSKI